MTEPTRSLEQPASIIADLPALLLQLGRPGAILRTVDGSSTICVLRQQRKAHRRIEVDTAIVRSARASSLIETATDQTGCVSEVLSSAGRSLLRATLTSAPASPRTVVTGDRRKRRGAAATVTHSGRLSPLEQLGQRRDSRGKPLLDAVQIAAAMRFAADFAHGRLQPRVTARWSAEASAPPRRRGVPGAGMELPETTAAAQARVHRAMASLGNDQTSIVVDVCCFEFGLTSVEATHHWPAGTARIVLGIALNALADHYGMRSTASAHATTRRWDDGTATPSADAWTTR